MKPSLPLFLAVCLTVLCLIPGRIAAADTPSIVGTWSGRDSDGSLGAFVFRADGTADMIKDGVSMKNSVVKGDGTITYRLDAAAKPIALDIVITKGESTVMTLQCIVEFLSTDRMKVRRPTGKSRPLDFDGAKDEVIVLEKQSTERK